MRRFEALADRLLSQGVAYRHVRRYIAELRDHYDDAVGAEIKLGASAAEAEEIAAARLGTPEDLARGMMARPELRALSARFPRLWNGGAPALLWISGVIGVGFLLGGLVWLLGQLGFMPQAGSQLLASFQEPTNVFIAFILRVAPVLVGGISIALALRQRCAMSWPLIGAGLLAAIAGTAEIAVHFSTTPGVKSSLGLNVGLSPDIALRTAMMLAVMLMPLAFKRRLTRLPA